MPIPQFNKRKLTALEGEQAQVHSLKMAENKSPPLFFSFLTVYFFLEVCEELPAKFPEKWKQEPGFWNYIPKTNDHKKKTT